MIVDNRDCFIFRLNKKRQNKEAMASEFLLCDESITKYSLRIKVQPNPFLSGILKKSPNDKITTKIHSL